MAQRSKAKQFVVDADVHTAYRTPEIRQDIADRMDEPYRSYLLEDSVFYSAYPLDSFPKQGESTTEDVVVHSPETIQRDLCEGFGVDVAILNSLQKLDLIPSRERAVQEMRAVNDMFLERFLEDYDQFYGLAMLTTQEPEATAEEIDRIGGEESFVGVMIANGDSDKPIGDPRYDAIFRAAEDNDLPVCFHTSSVGYANSRRLPFLYNDLQHYGELHMLAHPFAHIVDATSLIMNETVEKFPDLDFVFLEQDLSIVPLLMYRLNRETVQNPGEVPMLSKAPEEYIRERFYWGTQPMPEPLDSSHLTSLIEMIGVDNILFTSDHPHNDFDDPGSVIDRYLTRLPDEDVDKIMYENAMDVFGIDL